MKAAICASQSPGMKQVLSHALDRAGRALLGDEHVLLGMLSVPDSDAARVLSRLGVTLERTQAVVDGTP